ncbi:MAG: ankyrin repeat domain-containing protein [Moraxellaceae bacterium]|nr:ankyrin repeat domain-containing protein [Moraxellaceae bacterium]
MGAFPSFQAILQEVHQGLVGYASGEGPSTKSKLKFAEGEMSLDNFQATGGKIIGDIFDALDLDEAAWRDMSMQMGRMEAAYYRLKRRTWTFSADGRQVVWLLASHFLVPGIARNAAFWALQEVPDKDMPGGTFWYLPQITEAADGARVHMPVAQVMDWLVDLMGESVYAAAIQREDLKSKAAAREDSFMRTLYNWRSGKLVPQIQLINSYFRDDADLRFEGALSLSATATDAERWEQVMAFVERKGLTAEALRRQIPITQPGRLEAVLAGDAGESEMHYFVRCLSDRYSQPSMSVIRRRLLVARMVQDGYVRLLKFLCPGVEKDNADVVENKVLQLVAVYQYIYNLTIEAHRRSEVKDEVAENECFEKLLRPWDALTLYLSILPSQFGANNEGLAELLTRQFMAMAPGASLEDQFSLSIEVDARIAERRLKWLKQKAEEEVAKEALLTRIRSGSPWRALQVEANFWVVSQVGLRPAIGAAAQQQALSRLRELASSDSERMTVIIAELQQLLNPVEGRYLPGTQGRVEALLEQAESNPCASIWRAPLLHYRARHLLAMNEFKQAASLYRQVLSVCKDQCFGPLEGEAARDLMAIDLADARLVNHSYESLFMRMLREGVVEGEEMPRLEDAARAVSAYFWSDLYRPYPGVCRREPVAKALVKGALEVMKEADPARMRAWILSNKKILQKPLPYVQGDSIMLSFIKAGLSLEEALPRFRRGGYGSEGGFAALQSMAGFWRDAVLMLVDLAPQQLNMVDFKGQTPLMLMAECGDHDMVVRMLAAGADPDMQDYRKRTALHAAVRSGNVVCVERLLAAPCRTDLVMHEGQTPLHTAVIFGNLKAARLLLDAAPELAWKKDIANESTPLELAEGLLEYQEARLALESEMRRNGRRCVNQDELKEMVSLLLEYIERPGGV